MGYQPMLLQKTEVLPEGKDWIYERKYDGWRFLGYHDADNDRSRLISRGGNDYTAEKKFSIVAGQIAAAVSYLNAVVDGEIVGEVDGEHTLRTLRVPEAKLVYYVFDLLDIDGIPLVGKRWSTRRKALEEVFQSQPNIKLAPYYDDKDKIIKEARKLHYEGIVAKNIRGVYSQDRRTHMALKQKSPEYRYRRG
jgi:bifunctional non-homologous end joining protein LigD